MPIWMMKDGPDKNRIIKHRISQLLQVFNGRGSVQEYIDSRLVQEGFYPPWANRRLGV